MTHMHKKTREFSCLPSQGGCGRKDAFKLTFQSLTGALVVHIDCAACGLRQSFETDPTMIYHRGTEQLTVKLGE